MPRKKKETVFPGYIRMREPEKEALGQLVERAIGEKRSLTEFAELCGVSPSTISRIVNGKFTTPISDCTILAIAENADPDSGVSLEDLLAVHGLAPIAIEADVIPAVLPTEHGASSESTEEKPKMKVFISYAHMDKEESASVGKLLGVDDEDSILRIDEFNLDFWNLGMYSPSVKVLHDTSRVEDLVDKANKWANVKNEVIELKVRNTIQNLLIEHGYSIQLHKDYNISTLPEFRYKTHFAFTTDAVAGYGLSKWAFEVLTDNKYSAVQKLSWIFGLSYLDSPYKTGTKVSLVLFDKEEFDLVKDKFTDIVIQDCISVILMNKKNSEVIEEFQITQAGVEQLPSVLVNA